MTPAAQRLGAAFEASGIHCKLTDDVVAARWQKAVWNAAFNPISIMGGVLDTAMMLNTPQDVAFVRQVMREVCDVAAANGCPQPPQLIERMIAGTREMPAYKTSMAVDYENGRPMEIEAILGNVIRAGHRANVPMPALESIYALARMIEGGRKKRLAVGG
jgi:2-dehydropantoate 2-reductase